MIISNYLFFDLTIFCILWLLSTHEMASYELFLIIQAYHKLMQTFLVIWENFKTTNHVWENFLYLPTCLYKGFENELYSYS